MITDLFFSALGALVGFVAGLIDLVDLPDPGDTIGQASGAWATVVGYMAGAAGWLAFDVALACLAVIAALGLAAVSIKLIRIAASFLTLGGGSAA